jgi:Rieske Fe-S protein
MSDWPDRLNEFVESLRADRRPERKLAQTPSELEDLRIAARLAGARQERAEPDPAFLADLRSALGLERRRGRFRVTRGRLLRAAGVWAAGVASGIAIHVGIQSATRPAAPAPAAAQPAPPGILAGGPWFPVATFSTIPQGAVLPVDAGAVPAFIIREGNSMRSLSRVCTHMGCLLRFDSRDRDFDCPCHGASFHLDGQAKPDYNGGSLPSLPPIEVRVVNDTVYVLGA